MSNSFSDFLEDQPGDQLGDTRLDGDDLWAIFESLDSVAEFSAVTPLADEGDLEAADSSPKSKSPRIISPPPSSSSSDQQNLIDADGQQRMSHITVERNRRKQMNEHLSVLRSLMPCFYVKRGDQASIIGGVVDYINELQQVLQSLEAKKQRKAYSCEVVSPRNNMNTNSPRLIIPSPAPLISPRKPPLSSPRLQISLPSPLISPTTPQPCSSPYSRPRTASIPTSSINSPTHSSSSSSCIINSSNNDNNVNDPLPVANSKSPVADVEVKFSGSNLLLKTVSPRIPGQAVKIISALQDLSLEILHVNISTADESLHNSFTVKIGIECRLSAEELAQQIQQTFC